MGVAPHETPLPPRPLRDVLREVTAFAVWFLLGERLSCRLGPCRPGD